MIGLKYVGGGETALELSLLSKGCMFFSAVRDLPQTLWKKLGKNLKECSCLVISLRLPHWQETNTERIVVYFNVCLLFSLLK